MRGFTDLPSHDKKETSKSNFFLLSKVDFSAGESTYK